MDDGYRLLRSFTDRIAALPERSSFSGADLLVPQFQLQREENLAIFYAPLEHVNRRAKLILLGITPGFTQMEISYRVARRGLLDGLPEDVLFTFVGETDHPEMQMPFGVRTPMTADAIDVFGRAHLLRVSRHALPAYASDS
jgi:hypothetical protein